ncbi:MAG: N-acetyltransferase [Pseudomonadota bacterium]
MIRLLPETPDDSFEVEYLYDTCFAPGRQALSSYRLRDAAPVAGLSHLLRDEYDSVVGAIRHWPVRIGAGGAPALLLGPVAIHPTRQGEGLGGLLIRDALERAEALGWLRVVLIGDAPYYARFGFAQNTALEFPPPTNPARILSCALAEGAFEAVAGMVHPWGENPVAPA